MTRCETCGQPLVDPSILEVEATVTDYKRRRLAEAEERQRHPSRFTKTGRRKGVTRSQLPVGVMAGWSLVKRVHG